MFLRLPWLLSRKRLLAAVVADTCLFSILYILSFAYRFRAWPGLSFPVGALVTFWVLSSYVIGRYQASLSGHGNQLLALVFRTLATLFLSIGGYLVGFWLTAVSLGAMDSRAFLVPLLLVFAFLSSVSQSLLARVILANANQSHHWLFLGEVDTLDVLGKQLSLSRLPAYFTIYDERSLLQDVVNDHCAGVLVSDFSALPVVQEQQLLSLQQKGVRVLSLVGWCEQVLQRFPPELLTNADLLRGEFSLIRFSMQLRFKRLGDVLVSGFLLVLTAPIVAVAAVLIRFEDGGPVLYSQLRSGFNGKPYRIWKLRTMIVEAERYGSQWVVRGDSRITRLGRLLRLTRLDELPQLWAVLLGEMSLIGPRPERPEIEQHLERQIPHYRLRHLMRPGLSGWAQVNYPYGASVEDAANKLSYDLYYLRNFSFWLDLLILFKTIRLVFNAQGAVPISQEPSKP